MTTYDKPITFEGPAPRFRVLLRVRRRDLRSLGPTILCRPWEGPLKGEDQRWGQTVFTSMDWQAWSAHNLEHLEPGRRLLTELGPWRA